MDRPSKTFSKAGFYLIILFTFFVPLSPAISNLVAVLAFALWIIEQAIFRNTDWIQEEMFYPVAGFVFFTLLSFLVTRIYSSISILPYTGYLAVFYFVVHRFVSLSEKRKMIIWTFIAGVVLSSAIDIVMRFSLSGLESSVIDPASEKISFFIMIAFSLILAFYAEGRNLKEKLFFGLISMPLAVMAIMTFNLYVILSLLFLALLIGIFKDRSALIPATVFIALYYSGIFNGSQEISASEVINIAQSPFRDILENGSSLANISFFGMRSGSDLIEAGRFTNSFFVKLLLEAGPPAFFIFFWILFKQFRSELVKFRKITFREMKAFHLGIILAIGSFILLSLEGSVFDSSSAVLVFWMILGMSEI
jgi:hypothetical protein